MNDKKFIVLSSVFFLLFIFGMGSLLFEKPVSQFLQAQTSNPSSKTSFITAIPQIGGAVGAKTTKPQAIKVDIYVRSDSGDLMPKRIVQLHPDPNIVTISPSDTQTTNANGQAEFILSSSSPGKVTLTATENTSHIIINNNNHPLSVEFTQ